MVAAWNATIGTQSGAHLFVAALSGVDDCGVGFDKAMFIAARPAIRRDAAQNACTRNLATGIGRADRPLAQHQSLGVYADLLETVYVIASVFGAEWCGDTPDVWDRKTNRIMLGWAFLVRVE